MYLATTRIYSGATLALVMRSSMENFDGKWSVMVYAVVHGASYSEAEGGMNAKKLEKRKQKKASMGGNGSPRNQGNRCDIEK